MVGTKEPDWEGRADHAAQLQGVADLFRRKMEALIQFHSEPSFVCSTLSFASSSAFIFTVNGSSCVYSHLLFEFKFALY